MGSVFSGLSLDDLKNGFNPGDAIRRSVSRSRNVSKVTSPKSKPMLATKHEPFNRAGWLFEIKYDGYRLICEKQGARTTLTSRNGKDLTQTFPEIALAASRLPYEHIVLDGGVGPAELC